MGTGVMTSEFLKNMTTTGALAARIGRSPGWLSAWLYRARELRSRCLLLGNRLFIPQDVAAVIESRLGRRTSPKEGQPA